jgi:hypothetical protein
MLVESMLFRSIAIRVGVGPGRPRRRVVLTMRRMAQEQSKMFNDQSENAAMSSVAEASELLRHVAGPREADDSVKALVRRASHRLRWSFSRTRDIWYRNARRIDAAEMDKLRAEARRVEIEIMRARLLVLRNSLASTDPQFHCETIDALERALRDMGCQVGAVAFRKT